ncbi:penicillin acylase family protein [Shewanella woodyi]|uniref:Peptidase S45 penicillin amidase n=1 Tax=Shewanella woodyi (strain ATCC 51908 / MS32) TaxID=392500 RepID=B1KPU7_SHEWM|nr:penicillin acylase family protein [Shewanella woodyi]ACA87630.1 peptidase S45 penicillin amidase [Shewanella woodyi ATCC 51908]
MYKIIKIFLISTLSLVFILSCGIYLALNLSLPRLSGELLSAHISKDITLERDRLGTAVITGQSRKDVTYGLGFAHGQDRFFQMDLLRRNAAGELSEIFGEKALPLDKNRRFHQFRKRAEGIVASLPITEKMMLQTYANGVNDALAEQHLDSFEYLATGTKPKPWVPADSLLVIYSMYLDLQGRTPTRDMVLTQIEQLHGQEMLAFIIQNSSYQAALDGSLLPTKSGAIPRLSPSSLLAAKMTDIEEPLDIGSNNWAVTGELTQSGKGMLSDDMHLSLAAPIIWYRAQLNYINTLGNKREKVQVTGVSLPGAPAIVVGTNGLLAWGFTNAYIDTADWVALTPADKILTEVETIVLPDSNIEYTIELSRFGPVKWVNEQAYGLSWVAHRDYAVDMELMALETADSVEQGLTLATRFGIPVQNIMLVDSDGNAGWTPAGAVPSRTNPSNTAQKANRFQINAWMEDEAVLPQVYNPESQRLWSANSRVMSSQAATRFGDGGYALGARAQQIRDRLFESTSFTEASFLKLQLDNEARFLSSWHQYLIRLLATQPTRFAKDIQLLRDWQKCACADSVGYTLVRGFRTQLIDTVFAPLETELNEIELSLSVVKRYLEPAIWQIITEQPESWLPEQYSSWDEFIISSYQASVTGLLAKHSEAGELEDLQWGKVNQLEIKHPFSRQIPLLSRFLDMPKVAGYGDSFMPAVQRGSFGASQRFIIQPGLEEQAVMMVPGGQSGHPLSDYYRSGFDDYAKQKSTALLPSEILHKITIKAGN